VEQGLGGHAPAVQTGAPHLAALEQGHGQAAFGGPEGGGAAAGPPNLNSQLL